MKCLFLIVSMWLHRRFFGFWTIWWYLNRSLRFLIPHLQHLHGTPVAYALGRKSTADIREFGRQIYLWKLEGGKETKQKCGPCLFLNLGLQINTLGLWTLSFPPPFLLFQAVLCEAFFFPNVHVYIPFLGRKMSVMLCPAKFKVAFGQSQIIFSVLGYLYMMISYWPQSIFKMYFIFFSKISNSSLEICIVVICHYNKTICLVGLLKMKIYN